MSRPLIGITTYLEAARWGDWVREAVLSPPAYARAVERAGGAPVLLPPLGAHAATDYLLGLQGVVLTGGPPLVPAITPATAPTTAPGATPAPAAPDRHGPRDRFELALARAAVQADVPVLGIARGMHVLNVAQGGTLIPCLPDMLESDRHSRPGTAHRIHVSLSSRLGKVVGERLEMTAPHTQSVRRLGTGLLAVAWAEDQIVEGIELQGHRFGVGVQWHPERHPGDEAGDALFDALVEAAR